MKAFLKILFISLTAIALLAIIYLSFIGLTMGFIVIYAAISHGLFWIFGGPILLFCIAMAIIGVCMKKIDKNNKTDNRLLK